MGSNILGKILSGVGQGYLKHTREQEADEQDAKDWEKTKQRKRETLDMTDEYSQKSEARQRQQRVADEEAAYSKKLSRQDELQNKQIEQIKSMYPDRWADPMFQQEVTAGVKGLVVPKLPANKEIAALAMAGKIDEALKLALKSTNPEDRKFYDDVLDSITKKKRLSNLLNPQTGGADAEKYGFKPDANIIQSALNQGSGAASDMLARFIPGADQGIMQLPEQVSPDGNQAQALDEKSVKQVRQVRDDAAKELTNLRAKYRDDAGNFDPSLMKGTEDEYHYQEIEDRYKKAARMINSYSDGVLGGQQPGAQQTSSSPAMDSFMNMNRKVMDMLKPTQRTVVKRTQAK
ncbi:MAG: hypothetical protein KKB51_23675 [Candidatus Riflebacteria bacterium]|nr:hypothetical protein [Candidatus Riflebacteria bacterium]